jgi:hypothetical protein
MQFTFPLSLANCADALLQLGSIQATEEFCTYRTVGAHISCAATVAHHL